MEQETREQQAEIETALRGMIASQSIDQKKCAAISLLCDRMMLVDPSTTEFVRGLARLANEGEREANRRKADDIPWAALAQLLDESAREVDAREERRGSRW